MNGGLSLAEVARDLGVNPMTIRRWEKATGVVQPGRMPRTRQRVYSAEDVRRLRLYRDSDGQMQPAVLRQSDLTMKIGQDILGAHRLKPLGPQGSYPGPTIGLGNLDLEWESNQRMFDIAWWSVAEKAEQIAGEIGAGRVMDHAWAIGYVSHPFEPWAMVTEPYISEERARLAAEAVMTRLAHWSVRARALTAADSSWNPGQCVPIVFYIEQGHGYWELFMREALAFALRLAPPVRADVFPED